MMLSAIMYIIKIILAQDEGCDAFPVWIPNEGPNGTVECGKVPTFSVGHVCNWTCPPSMYLSILSTIYSTYLDNYCLFTLLLEDFRSRLSLNTNENKIYKMQFVVFQWLFNMFAGGDSSVVERRVSDQKVANSEFDS